MKHSLEDLKIYQVAIEISDTSWNIYCEIPKRLNDLSGQFIRASDSIGANIAEGYGRGTFKDRKHFLIIARGSLKECMYWLNLLIKRNLISVETGQKMQSLLDLESIMIMGYIKYLNSKIP
jgi:four helix bundle protein